MPTYLVKQYQDVLHVYSHEFEADSPEEAVEKAEKADVKWYLEKTEHLGNPDGYLVLNENDETVLDRL